jgi:hypothetical protein
LAYTISTTETKNLREKSAQEVLSSNLSASDSNWRRLMNRTFLFALLLAVLSAVNSSQAAVFERDWKTPGDGLLTYDDVNQREWLDLSASRLDQFSEPRIENAISQIATGGLFEGFTWAKRDDVRALAESAGVDTSTSDIAINQAPTTTLIELLSPTSQSPFGLRAIALIDEPQMRYPLLPAYDGAALLVNFNGFAGMFLILNDDELRLANGLMLYRTVPEPSPRAIMLMGALLIVGGRSWG